MTITIYVERSQKLMKMEISRTTFCRDKKSRIQNKKNIFVLVKKYNTPDVLLITLLIDHNTHVDSFDILTKD